jgi:branched-chain amino acid transport system permease protein
VTAQKAAALPAASESLRPAELWTRRLLPLAVLLVLAAIPLFRPVISAYTYWLQILTTTFMWIALSSSWNIIGGFTGYVSLGHNVFFAVGGYFSAGIFVYYGVSPFLTALGAGLVCVLVGLVFGLIMLRTSGDAFIIATIALLLIARILFDNWELLGGSNGLSLPLLTFDDPLLLPVPFYYAMLLCAAGAVLFAFWVRHSKFGLGLRAIAEDEVRAEMAGINTRLLKIAAFAASGFFIGVAGAMWGYSLSYLRPEIFLTINIAAQMVLMAVIGGKGTILGPVIGAVLIVTFNEAAVSKFGSTELNIAVTGGFLIAALLFFPQGIVGSLRDRRRLPRALDWG